MRSKFFAALALCAGLAAPLSAQTEITPFIGTVVPMTSLLVDTGGVGGFRMQAHTIYGVRFMKPMSPTFGLELALGAGSGSMQVASTEIVDLKTSVYFADLRARVRVAGNDDAQLGVIAGAGWTQFSSGYFDAAHEQDEGNKLAGRATGLVGIGVKAKVGGRITLSFDALDRIHEQSIEAPGLDTDQYTKFLQHDLTFTAGLAFPLGS